LCVRHRRAHVGADVHVRAGACAYGRPRIRAANVRARSVGVDRVRLGSQAFNMASAFNANIGVWNTAAVTSMAYVCAAFGRRRATASVPDALGRSSMRRGRCARRHRRCARARVRTRIGNSLARASAGVCIAARRRDSIYMPEFMVTYLYIYMYIGIDTGCGHARRRAANVRAPSVGVERVRFGSQALASATAFNANIGAWNTARVADSYSVCAAFGRRRATASVPDALARSMMQRGRCARRHRRCAHV
jgi:hypothetical protein